MKSNKLLLGLFVGALMLTATPAMAQTAFGDNFHEVGPDNIGGPISSIIIDKSDASQSTVYAGAYTGGLFVRHSLEQLNWERVPYMQNGVEVNLPVSSMVQGPDNTIYIGTGDAGFSPYNSQGLIAMKGKGVFRLDPTTNTFTLIEGTEPTADFASFHAVYAIDYTFSDDGTYFYLYCATYKGVQRIQVPINNGTLAWDEADVVEVYTDNTNPTITQMVLSRDRGVGYFTVGSKLLKMTNINDAADEFVNIEDITLNKVANDSSVVALTIAMAPSDNNYLYVMASKDTISVYVSQGARDTTHYYMVKSMYLTHDDENWTRLASPSFQPLSFTHNQLNSFTDWGTICVNDTNPKIAYVGAGNIWTGRGYVDGSYFQWMRTSANESQLNYTGNYMSDVFSSAGYVHSGIHQIVKAKTTISGIDVPVYYIATNGGVFITYNSFGSYANLNRGLNCTQIKSVAVAPDGSVISGSINNAAPFIQSRMAHNGGNVTTSWFDDGSLGNFNHDANMIWAGDAGRVDVSSFQQVQPMDRRTLFLSSPNNYGTGYAGRAYADYFNYTQTQTWTIGQTFSSHVITRGNTNGYIYLWENANDSIMIDSVNAHINLKGVLRPNGIDTLGFYTLNEQKVAIRNHTDTIPAGAKVLFTSRANNDYPFEYTYPEFVPDTTITRTMLRDTLNAGTGARDTVWSADTTIRTAFLASDTIRVKNPVISRALFIGVSDYNLHEVFLNITPNDFSCVYDPSTYNSRINYDKQMHWYSVFSLNPQLEVTGQYQWPTAAVFSNDGSTLYVAVSDSKLNQSRIFRIGGFDKIDYNAHPDSLDAWLKNRAGNPYNKLAAYNDTLHTIEGETWFPRTISSISVDPRPGTDRILITFDGTTTAFSNLMIIDNASTSNWKQNGNYTEVITPDANLAAFSAIVEKTTGNLIVGTSDGIIYSEDNGATWNTDYPYLKGVPVTSIAQQTREYPVRRHTGYNGINQVDYLFAKTKWPGAIYFGTYGRGIFLDMSYVTDLTNEVLDPEDLGIPTVAGNGLGSINIYPNPAVNNVNIELNSNREGMAHMTVYDLNGRAVSKVELGRVQEGTSQFSYNCANLPQGMYLVNINVAGQTAATKLIVR